MRVRVLGEVVVLVDGDPVRIGGRNQRAVLAVLAARPRVAVPADLLVDAVWGDGPPRSAVASLRTYVSRLRRLLGDCLVIGSAVYTLALGDDDIDAGRFEQLVDRAGHSSAPDAIALLDEAMALWRGDAFGDVSDLEAVRGAASRLEELGLAAQEARAASLLAAGRPGDAVGAAEQLVAEHPLREGAWVVLVEALTAVTRLPEALRAYQRAASALAEAGLEPSDRLRRAEAAALANHDPELGPRPLAVVSSSLVGRDDDVAAVSELGHGSDG